MKINVYQLCAIALLFSCQQGIEIDSPQKEALSALDPGNKSIIINELPIAKIGNQLPNPLELGNVKKAFDLLDIRTKNGLSSEDILPTHHYVAFTPSNEDELSAIQSIDENQIIIHYYPVDYEVSDGLITPDERFMTNGYSFYWAYVPIDFDLSLIQCPYIHYYDIVALDEEIVQTKRGGTIPTSLADSLMKIAYSICDIELNPIISTRADVHPSGYIKFFDTDYNMYRPVNGFKVRAIRGTHHCYMNCDQTGYFYSSDTFKYAFQYEFMFKRDYFEIVKNNETSFAVIKLSGQTGPVDVSFSDDVSCFMATIDRAAITYYYGNNQGLRRPPKPSDKVRCLTIHAQIDSSYTMYKVGASYVDYCWPLNPHPVNHVFRKQHGVPRPLMSIYETTIHELAHSSMWLDNSDYSATESIVKESFAEGIAWAMTTAEYSSMYTHPDYFRCSYTGIVQDMIDDPYHKQKSDKDVGVFISPTVWVKRPDCTKYYFDFVSGVNLAYIEIAARASSSWDEWRDNMVSFYPEYESAIVDLFNHWNMEK